MAKVFKEKVIRGDIFAQGDEAKDIFIVKRGVIILQIQGNKIEEICQGKLFGHEDLLTESKRTLSACTLGNSICTVLYSSVLELSSVTPIEIMKNLIRQGKQKQIQYHILNNDALRNDLNIEQFQRELINIYKDNYLQDEQQLPHLNNPHNQNMNRSSSTNLSQKQQNKPIFIQEINMNNKQFLLQNSILNKQRHQISLNPYFATSQNEEIKPQKADLFIKPSFFLEKLMSLSSKPFPSTSKVNTFNQQQQQQQLLQQQQQQQQQQQYEKAEYCNFQEAQKNQGQQINEQVTTPTLKNKINTPPILFSSSSATTFYRVNSPLPQPTAWQALQVLGYQNNQSQSTCNEKQKPQLKFRSTLTSFLKSSKESNNKIQKNDISTSVQDFPLHDNSANQINQTLHNNNDPNSSFHLNNIPSYSNSERNINFQIKNVPIPSSPLMEYLHTKKEDDEEFELSSRYIPSIKQKNRDISQNLLPLGGSTSSSQIGDNQKKLQSHYYESKQSQGSSLHQTPNHQQSLHQSRPDSHSNSNKMVHSNSNQLMPFCPPFIERRRPKFLLQHDEDEKEPLHSPKPQKIFTCQQEIQSPKSPPALFANSILSIHLKNAKNKESNSQKDSKNDQEQKAQQSHRRGKMNSKDFQQLDAMSFSNTYQKTQPLAQQQSNNSSWQTSREKCHSIYAVLQNEKSQLSRKTTDLVKSSIYQNNKREGYTMLNITSIYPKSHSYHKEAQNHTTIRNQYQKAENSTTLPPKSCLQAPLSFMANHSKKIKLRVKMNDEIIKSSLHRSQINKSPQSNLKN